MTRPILIACAALSAFVAGPTLAATPDPALRIEIDLDRLLAHLAANPHLQRELAHEGLPLLLRSLDLPEDLLRQLHSRGLDGLPRRAVATIPGRIWGDMQAFVEGANSDEPLPDHLLSLAVRATFANPDAAGSAAAQVADLTHMQPAGPDRWHRPPLVAPGQRAEVSRDEWREHLDNPSAELRRRGAELVFGLDIDLDDPDANAPGPRLPETTLLTARGAASGPIVANGMPRSYGLTVELTDRLSWRAHWTAPAEWAPTDLLRWAPPDLDIWYDGFTRLDQLGDRVPFSRAIAGFFEDMQPGIEPGFLLVAGAGGPVRIDGPGFNGAPLDLPAMRLPTLALVVPAADPPATLARVGAELKRRYGVMLAPHTTTHGGPTLRPTHPEAELRQYTVSGPFDLHVFAGPDALVFSTDDTLSRALVEHRAHGAHRSADERARIAVLDRGGSGAFLQGATESLGVFLRFTTDGPRVAAHLAQLRFVRAMGRLSRTRQRLGEQIVETGALDPLTQPLPTLDITRRVDEIRAWMRDTCAAGNPHGIALSLPGDAPLGHPGGVAVPARRLDASLLVARDLRYRGAPWVASGRDDAKGRALDRALLDDLLPPIDEGVDLLVTAGATGWRVLDTLRAVRAAGHRTVRLLVAAPDPPAPPPPPDPERARAFFEKVSTLEGEAVSRAFVDAVSPIVASCRAVARGIDALYASVASGRCEPLVEAMTAALAQCPDRTRIELLSLLHRPPQPGLVRITAVEVRLDDGPPTWAEAAAWADVAPKLLDAGAVPIGAP